MTLPSLYIKVINILNARSDLKDEIAPADVIAVCLQESNGEPCFDVVSPEYKQNLYVAQTITGLPAQFIVQAMTIKSGPYEGEIAKFRLEPTYWTWSAKILHLSPAALRIPISCSIGVGQQMMRWVLVSERKDWAAFIEDFKGNLDTQLNCLITELKRLMIATDGDLFRAYKGYNSGNVSSTDPAVIARAQHVVALRDQVQKELSI